MNNEEFEKLLEAKIAPIEPQTARVAFKNWPINVQRRFLVGLISEHAYACGVAGELLEVRGINASVYASDLAEGVAYRLRDK